MSKINIFQDHVLSFITGLILADGCVHADNSKITLSQSIRIGNDSNNGNYNFMMTMFDYLKKSLSGNSVKITEYKGKKPNNTGVTPHILIIEITDRHFYYEILKCGIGPEKSEYSDSDVFDQNKNKKCFQSFLFGFLIGDGSFSVSEKGSTKISFYSKNDEPLFWLRTHFSGICKTTEGKYYHRDKPDNPSATDGLGEVSTITYARISDIMKISSYIFKYIDLIQNILDMTEIKKIKNIKSFNEKQNNIKDIEYYAERISDIMKSDHRKSISILTDKDALNIRLVDKDDPVLIYDIDDLFED